jgi:hypothetical protein
LFLAFFIFINVLSFLEIFIGGELLFLSEIATVLAYCFFFSDFLRSILVVIKPATKPTRNVEISSIALGIATFIKRILVSTDSVF